MKYFVIMIIVVAIFFTGCGHSGTKTPISRNFATLMLGMTGDEYRAGGWHNGFTKIGKIEALAYTGSYHVCRNSEDWAEKDKRIETKYSAELTKVREIYCVFFNDKLCIIQIA